jgi:hypothetical protein
MGRRFMTYIEQYRSGPLFHYNLFYNSAAKEF